MQVLGLAKEGYGDADYICKVTHAELKQFLNTYYTKEELKILKVGDVIDLGKGYDFYQQTSAALKKTQDFIESHETVIKAILTGICTMGKGE